ncbi:hypothetical protein JCM10207_007184 [Rhodosporidiobolus poonsookiae]
MQRLSSALTAVLGAASALNDELSGREDVQQLPSLAELDSPQNSLRALTDASPWDEVVGVVEDGIELSILFLSALADIDKRLYDPVYAERARTRAAGLLSLPPAPSAEQVASPPLTADDEDMPFRLPCFSASPPRSSTQSATALDLDAVKEEQPQHGDLDHGFDSDEDHVEPPSGAGIVAPEGGARRRSARLLAHAVRVQEESEDEDGEESEGGRTGDKDNDSDGFVTGSDEDEAVDGEDSGAESQRVTSGKKRTRSSTRGSSIKVELLPAPPTNTRHNPRAVAPSPSFSPSPAKKPKLDLDSSSEVLNPFNSSSWNYHRPVPSAPVAPSIPTPYIRQAPGPLRSVSFRSFPKKVFTISHSDMGGANSGAVRDHIFLTHKRNNLPEKAGEPLLIVFLSGSDIVKARTLASQGPVSLFRTRKEESGWFYHGEMVEAASSVLRGGPAFRSLPEDQQDGWVRLIYSRLNAGSDEAQNESWVKAAREENWRFQLPKGRTDAGAIRAALEQDPQIHITWMIWRCTGFSEQKVAGWQAAKRRA